MAVTRVAAIDCGTNSIRLLVADPPRTADGPLVDVVRRMEIVRLGQGVDATGRLAPEAIERTRVVLAGYADQIEKLGATRVRMCATSATRDAANAVDFHTMVRATLGVDPEVVTGDEEARLSFTGAVRGLTQPMPGSSVPPGPQGGPSSPTGLFLVVDIGGGSTEFVVGTPADGVRGAISVDIGCVRMTERHLHADPPTAEQIAGAEADIAAHVDRALAAVPGCDGATLVGLAGSVTTVAAIAFGLTEYQPERIHHRRVPYRDVARVTADLLAGTVRQRLDLPVMHPGRADVIGAGALVLRVIMERAGMDSVLASEHDILDGIAWSLRPAG